jgi:hypothetical protein
MSSTKKNSAPAATLRNKKPSLRAEQDPEPSGKSVYNRFTHKSSRRLLRFFGFVSGQAFGMFNNKETPMNLRCSYCQIPFTLGRIEKLDALQEMYAKNLNHYDAHCPRCRRATPVPRQKLEMTMPNWREALKELEQELAAHPQPAAPLAAPEPAPAPQAESKPEHRKRAGKPAQPPPASEKPAKEKPAKKKTTAEQPAAEKPAKEKPAAQKPAKQPKATAKKSK